MPASAARVNVFDELPSLDFVLNDFETARQYLTNPQNHGNGYGAFVYCTLASNNILREFSGALTFAFGKEFIGTHFRAQTPDVFSGTLLNGTSGLTFVGNPPDPDRYDSSVEVTIAAPRSNEDGPTVSIKVLTLKNQQQSHPEFVLGALIGQPRGRIIAGTGHALSGGGGADYALWIQDVETFAPQVIN